MRQEQFLNLATAEAADQRFREAVQPQPLGEEVVQLAQALRRVLSRDVTAQHNVPFFDRSNFDGFAVRAEDTFGAEETQPVQLRVNSESLHCGVVPQHTVAPGTATPISTGGVIPRGADGVVLIENTHPVEGGIHVLKPIAPGSGISHAGSDIGAGEVVLRRGDLLGHRETGTLAALGEAEAWVWRKPRVGILSTGDELVAPGSAISTGRVFDCNSTMLAHAVEELGGEAVRLGVVQDDESAIEQTVRTALAEVDLLLLSAGTSKGEGDQNYRVFQRFGNPGILVHGVALKPGKPLCLAVLEGTPAAILPGFPTSAIFTFTRFIAPVLRAMLGLPPEQRDQLPATLPMQTNSDKGRTEFHLVHLLAHNQKAVRPEPVEGPATNSQTVCPEPVEGLATNFTAYPTGKGSGSVTGFARADGFIEIPREVELVEAGSTVSVQLLGQTVQPPDLMAVGSHCVGLDYLLGVLREQGFLSRSLVVGSMGGVLAARRGECDLAGTHLMDANTGHYNAHLLTPELRLVKGYRRRQGLVFRKEDEAFAGLAENSAVLESVLQNPELRMVNRNRGSGTRVLLDQLLQQHRPPGFFSEAKSHTAVAAAVAQGRADWGIAIQSVAEDQGLAFHFLQDEEYDFLIPESRIERPALQALLALLEQPEVQAGLRKLGLARSPKS